MSLLKSYFPKNTLGYNSFHFFFINLINQYYLFTYAMKAFFFAVFFQILDIIFYI